MLFPCANPALSTRLAATTPFAGLALLRAAESFDATATAVGRLWQGAQGFEPRAFKGAQPSLATAVEMYRGTPCSEQSALIRRSGHRGRSRTLPE